MLESKWELADGRKEGEIMKVELLKAPTKEDWTLCKICTLNTVGKKITNDPTDEWKVKLLESEHSPIRTLWFCFRLEIPYWVSVHLVRHHVGCEHYVQSQRDDRNNSSKSRAEKPQGEMVSHIIYLNAQSFVNIAHARLCKQASVETRYIVSEMVRLAVENNPEFKSVLVPKCVYRNGKCTEFNPCISGKTSVLEDDGK